jgi:hypothetical protein
MRTAHASETTMKGEQGRGAVKVFGEASKDRAATSSFQPFLIFGRDVSGWPLI